MSGLGQSTFVSMYCDNEKRLQWDTELIGLFIMPNISVFWIGYAKHIILSFCEELLEEAMRIWGTGRRNTKYTNTEMLLWHLSSWRAGRVWSCWEEAQISPNSDRGVRVHSPRMQATIALKWTATLHAAHNAHCMLLTMHTSQYTMYTTHSTHFTQNAATSLHWIALEWTAHCT